VRKFSLYVGALLALVAAGAAYSAASPSAKLEKQDRLYGGGQFAAGCFNYEDGTQYPLCFPAARNLSVDAHAEGNDAEAVGDANYAAPGSSADGRRSVTCLRVDGTHAVIGGIILTGSNAGWGFVQFYVDRGTVGSGPRDLVGPSFTDTVEALATIVSGFPASCPPPSGTQDLPAVYRELEWGDIVVQDAPAD
jgi:hypothetical protein